MLLIKRKNNYQSKSSKRMKKLKKERRKINQEANLKRTKKAKK